MYCDYVPPAHYEQMVENYRDKFGLIVQSDLDGGDAAHRVGVYYFGLYLIYKDNKVIVQDLKNKFEKELSKIKVDTGKYIRHPDTGKWYSNPQNFSRDQTTPLVYALGVYEQHAELEENFKHLIKNRGFYPNDLKNWNNAKKSFPEDYNDIAFMGDYGNYIRAFKGYAFYPFLLISDLTMFGNAVIRSAYSYIDPDNTSDDLNFTLSILQSDLIMPTPLSKVSKWIYSTFKAKNYPPAGGYQSNYPIQTAWDFYFRKESHGPPLNEVYRCLIEDSFYR